MNVTIRRSILATLVAAFGAVSGCTFRPGDREATNGGSKSVPMTIIAHNQRAEEVTVSITATTSEGDRHLDTTFDLQPHSSEQIHNEVFSHTHYDIEMSVAETELLPVELNQPDGPIHVLIDDIDRIVFAEMVDVTGPRTDSASDSS